MKKCKFSARSCGILGKNDSENRIIQILHRKGQKQIWTKLSSLVQEPTFNEEMENYPCITPVTHYYLEHCNSIYSAVRLGFFFLFSISQIMSQLSCYKSRGFPLWYDPKQSILCLAISRMWVPFSVREG